MKESSIFSKGKLGLSLNKKALQKHHLGSTEVATVCENMSKEIVYSYHTFSYVIYLNNERRDPVFLTNNKIWSSLN
jgi:hypothetical protein